MVAMGAHLIAATEREQDLAFAQLMARNHGLEFVAASTAASLKQLIYDRPQSIVLWDVDHPRAADSKHLLGAEAVGRALMGCIAPERVIAVSDKPLNATPYLFSVPAFNHHVFRRYEEPAPRVYARLALACLMPDPFGAGQYVPDQTPVRRITLKSSAQKASAIEAVSNVFTKLGGHPRLVSLLGQTCDELIMNAMFSAPVDKKGARFRKALPRTSEFELAGQEIVTVEMAATQEYAVILVADQFGSLQKQAILPFIQKDYSTHAYRAKADEASAGLGLYGILQAGLSLLFITKPGARTEVAVFMPLGKTPKQMKEGFRFFSFIFK
jgi:hypothetical protein